MKNIEQLIKKTEELITSLQKTNNSTIKVYEALLNKLKTVNEDTTLDSFLEGYPTSSKIVDVGGYTLDQIKLWEELWHLAKQIREEK